MKNRILELFSPPPQTHADRPDQPPVPAFDYQQWRASAERWIREHPGAALGAALTVGVFVGWLIKRR